MERILELIKLTIKYENTDVEKKYNRSMIIINELEKELTQKFGEDRCWKYLDDIICRVSIPKNKRIDLMENILKMNWR